MALQLDLTSKAVHGANSLAFCLHERPAGLGGVVTVQRQEPYCVPAAPLQPPSLYASEEARTMTGDPCF